MKFAFSILLACASMAAYAQTAAPPAGVSSEWDVRKLLDSLDAQAQHLKPIMDQIKPETWVAKGAPEAYVAQGKSAHAELGYLLTSSQALARDPEKLTL